MQKYGGRTIKIGTALAGKGERGVGLLKVGELSIRIRAAGVAGERPILHHRLRVSRVINDREKVALLELNWE